MVKHIILWKFKDDICEENKPVIRDKAKEALEGLAGQIEGLLTVSVETRSLASSNADFMLYTEFVDEAALKAYQSNPLHIHVADTYVLPYVALRLCMDVPETE